MPICAPAINSLSLELNIAIACSGKRFSTSTNAIPPSTAIPIAKRNNLRM
ncbi:Uncharacterised protein [Vibrio cholerae]|nr:Uncharacterised protein [Vibrio cholerae]CSC07078.1 Uncharacterised protein [Vibrio cholerae]CSC60041.1 Uncharacterised protein [Vibrio cholerae]CSC85481.1 Uncharacterised protein [Vibrio cholerae]CSI31386.1 Uncharacterised protein [Vibrio cholerae]